MEIKLKKQILYTAIITALITFSLCYFVFKYLPENSKLNEIKDYKKDLYNSLVCQYSCPLVAQNSTGNKTLLIPTQQCIQSCTESIKAKNFSADTLSNKDLENDNLIKDIESAVSTCRQLAIIQQAGVPELNNSAFFACVPENLLLLKEKYSYLK